MKSSNSKKQKLTKTVVKDALPDPDKKTTYIIWDSDLIGFGLRVRPTGNKSYVYVYRAGGKPKWMTISALTPDAAREQAKAMAAKTYVGGDPAEEKAEAKRDAERASSVLSVGQVLEGFIENHAKVHLKPKSWSEYERCVEKLLKPHIGKLKIDALETKDVAAMYQTLLKQPRQVRSKPKEGERAGGAKNTTPAVTQASGAIRVLSSAMSWAEEAGLRPAGSNPAKIRLKSTRRRQRLFSDAEVSRLEIATKTLETEGKIIPPVALGIRLLFATGCRAGEIAGLLWENVDFDIGLLRWPDSKTGYLEKPMTDEARSLLVAAHRTGRIVGVPWVLPSAVLLSRANEDERRNSLKGKSLRVETLEAGFERVMKKAGVVAGENATLHLIRHWFSTKTYTDKSIPLPVQMAIVGHSSVATAMRYAHVSREELAKAAKEAATRRFDSIEAAGKKGQVLAMGGDN